jgi:cation:H+ antiporter
MLTECTEAPAERYPEATLRLAITAFTAVMMGALITVGFIFHPLRRAVLKLTWISLGLFPLYILNSWVHFQHGS